jgi:hypothetical protein
MTDSRVSDIEIQQFATFGFLSRRNVQDFRNRKDLLDQLTPLCESCLYLRIIVIL